MEPVLGIDFGTSNICCAVWDNYVIRRVSMEFADVFQLPTILVWDNGDWTAGSEGRDLSLVCPEKTILDILSYVGLSPREAHKQAVECHAPFTFIEGADGQLVFHLERTPTSPVEIRGISIQRVLLCLLQIAKRKAEFMISRDILHCAVTTSPFVDCPRDLSDACKRAGFQEVLYYPAGDALLEGCRFYNVPLTAHDYPVEAAATGSYTVIVDIGYSGMAVYIYRDAELIQEKRNPIGGKWFDQALIDHCKQEFHRQHHRDISVNAVTALHLRLACEDAKKSMSQSTTVKWHDIRVERLSDELNLSFRLNVVDFEDICGPGLMEINRVVLTTMMKAKVDRHVRDTKLYLLGGGSRIACLRRLFSWAYPTIFQSTSAVDEMAAHGVAKLSADHLVARGKIMRMTDNYGKYEADHGQNTDRQRPSAELGYDASYL